MGLFASSIPVLCYHRIGVKHGLSLDLFRAHLDVIQGLGFEVIPLARLVRVMRGEEIVERRSVVLTFDDCTLDNWLIAAPELHKRGLTGAFFAVTDFIAEGTARRPGTHGELLLGADYPGSGEAFRAALAGDVRWFMNSGEIRAMVDELGMEVYPHASRHQGCFKNLRQVGTVDQGGHWASAGVYQASRQDFRRSSGQDRPWRGDEPAFEIGSAYAHDGFWPVEAPKPDGPRFRLRSPEARYAFCLEDFRRSKQVLENILDRPMDIFCWPWGAYDELSMTALREAGFTASATLDRGPNSPGGDPMNIRRIGVAIRKGPHWLRARLLMHGNSLISRLFGKRFRKKGEISSVLYSTNSSKGSGGSRQMVNNAIAMRDHGLRVVVCCPGDAAFLPDLQAAGVKTVETNVLGKLLPASRLFRSLAAQENIDVVHAFHNKAFKAALLARAQGARCKVFLNRGVIFPPSPLYAFWSRLVHGVICNSGASRNAMIKRGAPPKKVSVVLNAFIPDGSPAPRKPSQPAVIYSGSRKAYKGLDVFLKAVSILARRHGKDFADFQIMGFSASMDGFADKETLSLVNLLGALPHGEALQVFGRASVFVLTSRQESMPNTLLEAFDAELPVVCTAVGGVPDLVRNGVNGWLCASEDAEGVASGVEIALRDRETSERMGRFNRWLARKRLTPMRKGFTLLRVYSGERVVEELPFDELLEEFERQEKETGPRQAS